MDKRRTASTNTKANKDTEYTPIKNNSSKKIINRNTPHKGSYHESWFWHKIHHIYVDEPALFKKIVAYISFAIGIIITFIVISYETSVFESQTPGPNTMDLSIYNVTDDLPPDYIHCPLWGMSYITPVTYIQPSLLTYNAFFDTGCTNSFYYAPILSSSPTIGVFGGSYTEYIPLDNLTNTNIPLQQYARLYGSFSQVAGLGQRISVLSGGLDVPDMTNHSFTIVIWCNLDLKSMPNQTHVLLGSNSDPTLISGPVVLVNGTTNRVVVTDGYMYATYGTRYGYLVSTDILQTNRTYMITVTYNRTSIGNQLWSLYIDLEGEVSHPTFSYNHIPPPYNTSYNKGISIGNWGYNNIWRSFQGNLGQVMFFDHRVLTLNQIEVLNQRDVSDLPFYEPNF